VVTFDKPVLPKLFRIAVLHAPTGSVFVPPSVSVREGTPQRRGSRIGRNREIAPASGWVEIPLNLMAPAQHYWIEMNIAPNAYLLIEEVEFR
jgi:hypothetical protein